MRLRWWLMLGGLQMTLAAVSVAEPATGSDLLSTSPANLPAGWRAAEGQLVIAADGESHRVRWCDLPAAAEGRAQLVWRVREGGDLRLGLVCQTGIDTGWYAQLRADGYYWLGQITAGRAQPRLTGMVPALRSGEALTLRVEWLPGRQTTWLGDTPLSLPAAGNAPVLGLSLWATGHGRAEVAELRLDGPAQQPVTPPTVVTPPTEPPHATAGPGPEPGTSGPAEGSADLAISGTGAPGLPTRPPGEVPSPAVGIEPRPGGGSPGPLDPLRPTDPGQPAPAQPEPVSLPTAAEQVLFEEDFDPPRHQWNRDTYRAVEQGGLRLRAEDGYQLSGFPYDFGALRYRARVRSLTETGGTYGLVARLQADGGSGYLFVVGDGDQWAVARLDHGTVTVLTRGTAPLGAGEHRFEVLCQGADLAFAVDGRTLGRVADATYAKGGVGVWADNRRTALFDDLKVTSAVTAGAASAGGGRPRPSDGLLPVAEDFAAPRLSWPQDGQRELRGGALYLSSEPGRFTVAGLAEQRLSDYLVRVRGELVSAPEEGRVGLMVRLQADGGSGYLLACRADGSFVVVRLAPDGAELLSRGALALPHGVNTFWARCSGSSLVFGINQLELARLQDSTYGAGGFGVYCDHGAEARFVSLAADALPGVEALP